jgi:hypothetical protein
MIRRSTAKRSFYAPTESVCGSNFMAEPLVAFDAPDLAETIGFLRRFAELMSSGYNAAYLRRACELLETLAADAIATPNAEALWRFKCESMTRHADALQAECDALNERIFCLEARQPQLRSDFANSNRQYQAIEAQPVTEDRVGAIPVSEDATVLSPKPWSLDDSAVAASAIVAKSTLRQARAQFEFLAREFVPPGNIASQVMCVLAANAMDAALHPPPKEHPEAAEIARSILDI